MRGLGDALTFLIMALLLGIGLLLPVWRAPIPVAASAAEYEAQWLDQMAPRPLAPGERTLLWLQLLNTGTAAWHRNGPVPLRLGTSRPEDRPSPFYTVGSWLSPNRVPLMEEIVPPGQVGAFSFDVTAPRQPGAYREYFRPVVDGVGWLNDLGIYWDITVNGSAEGSATSGPSVITVENAAQVSLLRLLGRGERGCDVFAFQCLALAPDERTVATFAWSGQGRSGASTLQVWSVSDATLVSSYVHDAYTNAVAFSPDGQTIAFGIAGSVGLWRHAGGPAVRWLVGRRNFGMRSIAFSPDNALVAAAGRYEHARFVWRFADGMLLRTIPAQHGHDTPTNVAFSPDGKVLAGASEDGTVRLWRVSDGAMLRTLDGGSGPVWSATFSPNGALLASAVADGTVRLWRVGDGVQVRALQGHTGGTVSIAFSPDGTVLASGSQDATARLWEVATGRLLRTLTGHPSAVKTVAFASDGTFLASIASYDTTVRLWGVQ